MSFIHQESSFKSNAKPLMQYYFKFIPKGRISSAYGYAQALDSTWNNYKTVTKKQFFVSRSNFKNSIDFIGWDLNNIHKKIGINKTDAYNLYLAYHEGINGYKHGTYNKKIFLKQYAHKTALLAYQYLIQLKNCKIPPKPLLSYIFNN